MSVDGRFNFLFGVEGGWSFMCSLGHVNFDALGVSFCVEDAVGRVYDGRDMLNLLSIMNEVVLCFPGFYIGFMLGAEPGELEYRSRSHVDVM